jgi:hypothetical protein
MKKLVNYTLFLLFLHFGITTVLAANEFESDAIGLEPQTTAHGVTYVNGGVGNDEQKAIKAMRKDYNLQMTFAEKGSGEYKSDVRVRIENKSKKTIFDAKSIGPLFLIKLPAGTYRVMATSGDKEESQTVTVPRSGTKDLYFYW